MSVQNSGNGLVMQHGNALKSNGDSEMATKGKRSATVCGKVPTERQEQDKVVSWARLMVSTGQEPRLRFLRCGFEGLRLSMGVRMQMKRQSISTGWPDMFLAVPRRYDVRGDTSVVQFHGLFIELKRVKGGTVSAEQSKMIGDLNSIGYWAIVCRGADHAIREIKLYLGIT